MLGNGCITESFQRTEPRSDVARFAKSEYGTADTAWMAAGAGKVPDGRAVSGIAKAWRGFRAVAARVAAMLF